jgi:nitrogen fixation protein FixH
MTKEKTKDRGYSYDLHSYYASKSKRTGCGLLIILIPFFALPVLADKMTHKFKSPSFSGEATSAHYLTIENQEFNRKAAIKAEIKAYREQLARDAENTTLARFIRNLESRIYAQLSRQLVDALFGENPSTSGTLELMGNTIEYSVSEDGTMITLRITDAEGNVTEITVPIGSFTF